MAQESNELMDKLTALCKRRGFIFQSSEIYGGIGGFWDYGPLGVELKRNLKDAWWQDVVQQPRRHGRPGLLDHHEPQGLGGQRARQRLQRPHGRLQGLQGALPRRQGLHRDRRARARTSSSTPASRPTTRSRAQAGRHGGRQQQDAPPASSRPATSSTWTVFRADQHARRPGRQVPQVRRRADRGPQVQHDVQDLRRRDGGQLVRRVPSAGDGPGHLRQLPQRAGHLPHEACRWASPRSARASATRSTRGTTPSAAGSSSRWRSSSSAIPTRPTSGTSTGATRATSGT